MAKHKKVIALCLCIILLLAGAFGVYKGLTRTTLNLNGSSIAGQVTAVNGHKVTLTLGTLMDTGNAGGQPSFQNIEGGSNNDAQSNGNGSSSAMQQPSGGNGTTPTDIPSGTNGSGNSTNTNPGTPQGGFAPSGTAPSGNLQGGSAPSGTAPSGNPQGGSAPSGTAPSGNPQGGSTSSGNTPSGIPSGGDNMMQPGGMGSGSMFTAGSSTATLTIKNEKLITIESSDGSTKSGSLSDITVGSVLVVTFGKNNSIKSITIKSNASSMGGGNGIGSGSSTETNGTSLTTLDSDTEVSDKAYESSGDDENALRVENSAKVTLNNPTINKKGGSTSSTENSDFYGLNAGLLTRDGATLTINGGTITTNAAGGNGLFAYGNGTKVTISNTVINTSSNNSGGIDASGGSEIQASNLTVETQGNSSAAIRSDRGGGIINVDGGTYATHGTGSPAIYSTANITVSNATLNATDSEALVIEGKNSIALKNCTVTGSMSGTYADSNNENIHNVMLYQSMSGDADVGESSLTIEGGSLTAKSGDMFYVTNTTCSVSLTNVSLTYANGNLLTVAGNDSSRGWGTAGSNGGDCTFSCDNQKLEGIITVDDISSLTFSMKNNTSFTGTINDDKQAGTVNVTLDSNSTWTLTGNAYITSFDGSTDNIVTNGYHVYVNGKVLK